MGADLMRIRSSLLLGVGAGEVGIRCAHPLVDGVGADLMGVGCPFLVLGVRTGEMAAGIVTARGIGPLDVRADAVFPGRKTPPGMAANRMGAGHVRAGEVAAGEVA